MRNQVESAQQEAERFTMTLKELRILVLKVG